MPSSYSLMMVMQRWCRCGSVAVWRRDELSRLRDTSDTLLLSAQDGPGRLIPNLEHLSKASGSSTSTCTVQVTRCTQTKITRCYKLYVSNSLFNSTRASWQWRAHIFWTLLLNLCIQKVHSCLRFLSNVGLHPQLHPRVFWEYTEMQWAHHGLMNGDKMVPI